MTIHMCLCTCVMQLATVENDKLEYAIKLLYRMRGFFHATKFSRISQIILDL